MHFHVEEDRAVAKMPRTPKLCCVHGWQSVYMRTHRIVTKHPGSTLILVGEGLVTDSLYESRQPEKKVTFGLDLLHL